MALTEPMEGKQFGYFNSLWKAALNLALYSVSISSSFGSSEVSGAQDSINYTHYTILTPGYLGCYRDTSWHFSCLLARCLTETKASKQFGNFNSLWKAASSFAHYSNQPHLASGEVRWQQGSFYLYQGLWLVAKLIALNLASSLQWLRVNPR